MLGKGWCSTITFGLSTVTAVSQPDFSGLRSSLLVSIVSLVIVVVAVVVVVPVVNEGNSVVVEVSFKLESFSLWPFCDDSVVVGGGAAGGVAVTLLNVVAVVVVEDSFKLNSFSLFSSLWPF